MTRVTCSILSGLIVLMLSISSIEIQEMLIKKAKFTKSKLIAFDHYSTLVLF